MKIHMNWFVTECWTKRALGDCFHPCDHTSQRERQPGDAIEQGAAWRWDPGSELWLPAVLISALLGVW